MQFSIRLLCKAIKSYVFRLMVKKVVKSEKCLFQLKKSLQIQGENALNRAFSPCVAKGEDKRHFPFRALIFYINLVVFFVLFCPM